MFRRLLALCLTLLAVPGPAAASDEVEYAVVERDGPFELRQYPATLAAETLVTGTDFDEAGNVAFGRLFGYISGDNRSQARIAMTSPVIQTGNDPGTGTGEKIAMTSPVIQQAGERGSPSDSYRVAFMVPAGYTLATVPEPTNPAVRIVATPPRLLAALRFSGWMSEELHRKKEQALRAELATRKLVITGEPITAQYDAPFIPGPFRRNEVLIPVTAGTGP